MSKYLELSFIVSVICVSSQSCERKQEENSEAPKNKEDKTSEYPDPIKKNNNNSKTQNILQENPKNLIREKIDSIKSDSVKKEVDKNLSTLFNSLNISLVVLEKFAALEENIQLEILLRSRYENEHYKNFTRTLEKNIWIFDILEKLEKEVAIAFVDALHPKDPTTFLAKDESGVDKNFIISLDLSNRDESTNQIMMMEFCKLNKELQLAMLKINLNKNGIVLTKLLKSGPEFMQYFTKMSLKVQKKLAKTSYVLEYLWFYSIKKFLSYEEDQQLKIINSIEKKANHGTLTESDIDQALHDK